MQCLNLPTSGFKWLDRKKFDLNEYSSKSSKGCVLEVYLKYPKELRELQNDYPLSPDKIEIEREMLSNYQLKIADLYNIPIGNVKKLVSNFFDKEKRDTSKIATLLKIRIEGKNKYVAYWNLINLNG